MFIIGLIIFILFLLIFACVGENGFNKDCANANACPGSVRCRAKNKKECECFEEKKKRWVI